MAQSTYIPWWDAPDITTVVVTPTRLDAYGRCPLHYAEVHQKRPFDGQNYHLQRGTYIHALIHRYNRMVIAGEQPDIDDVLARIPLPIVPHTGDDREGSLLDFGRASLQRYTQFLQDRAYGILLAAEQYVRTPGRPVVGVPGAAIVLSGRFDVIAIPGSATACGAHATAARRVDAIDASRIYCIDIKTTSVAADLPERPSSFVYDHLARFVHGSACRISLVQWSAATGQTITARLTDEHIEAGKEVCRSFVASSKSQSWTPRAGEWCSHCPIVAHCPCHCGRSGWDTEF